MYGRKISQIGEQHRAENEAKDRRQRLTKGLAILAFVCVFCFYETLIATVTLYSRPLRDLSTLAVTVFSDYNSSNTSSQLAIKELTTNHNWASPACKPRFPSHPIRRIFFLHMRKAGGTTFRRYLNKVSKRYNITLDVREGSNTVENPIDDQTLYVTNLREPVARSLSHYKYDQRWSCRDLITKTFIPSKDNYKSTIQEFLVENVQRKEKKLWSCATNCYTRWVTGNFSKLPCSNRSHEHIQRLHEAREALLKYNLIIVTDKLREDEYIRKIESFFGGLSMKGTGGGAFCARDSAAANRKVPLVVDDSTLQTIQECNAIDLLLYNNLTTCPNGFEFPDYTPDYFQ